MAEVELWSTILEGESEIEYTPPCDLRITNIAFGEDLVDPNGRSVVKLVYEPLNADEDSDEEDEEEKPEDDVELALTVLTALTAGKIEQSTINVVLKEDTPYILHNTGKNTVFLTGNYIQQNDEPPFDDEEDHECDSDEEDYDLREVSSDVEMDPQDLDDEELDTDASRFEEVVEEAPKSAKRARAEADAPKAAKEKKNKKLKGEDGKAVPVEAPAPAPVAEKKEKKEVKEKKDTKAVRELPGGLKVQDTKVGDGPEAKKGSKVSVRYIGKLENGKIFDKNVKGKPFQFVIGKGNVIQGWDKGFAGMRVGGERILTVPPAMAYGKKGVDGIPPNATLKFEVKLIQVA